MKRSASAKKRPKEDDFSLVKDAWSVLNVERTLTITSDDERHEFQHGDIIYVAHKNTNLNDTTADDEYWIARILEIRVWDNDSVWILVEWFYRPGDLNGLKGRARSFNKLGWGNYELIQSDHRDIIPSSAISGFVGDIVYYDETKIDHAPIKENEYYCRYQLYTKDNSFSPDQILPNCCNSPYQPDEEVMRVCPRDGQAFHMTCLEKDSSSKEAVAHRRELALPSEAEHSPPLSKRVRFNSRATPKSKYRDIPKQLLSIARLPVLKGGGHGVAGNGYAVLQARKLLNAAVAPTDSVPVPDNWEKLLGGKKAIRSLIDPANAFKCPSCGDSI